MAQWLQALAALSEVLSSILSNHGGSQPSVRESDALFWPADVYAVNTLTFKKSSQDNKSK